jgi:hypothetical protein
MGMGVGIGMGKHTRRQLRNIAWDNGESMLSMFGKPAADISPQVLEFLEAAAEQYNRITGIIQAPATAGSLTKVGPSAIAAADETMAEILHQSATIDKYPESAAATGKQIENAIKAITELGDRLEDIATRDQLLTEKVNYASKMDSVLEELRLDQLARSELHTATEENQQKLQG